MKFKMTNQRRQIIEVLKQSQTPLSAELVFEKLDQKSINLSTVYRTIEVLMATNLITKIYLNNLAYYYYNRHSHSHYMVCEKCHHMVEIDCVSAHFKHVAEDHQFKMTHHDLVIYGICQHCQTNN